MFCSGKVFLLITFPPNCRHGHLPFLNFCRPLLEGSFFCIQNQMTLPSYLRLRQRNF
nr:uncharacterized protein LOC107842930 [Ipomoea batatas]